MEMGFRISVDLVNGGNTKKMYKECIGSPTCIQRIRTLEDFGGLSIAIPLLLPKNLNVRYLNLISMSVDVFLMSTSLVF